MTKDHKLNLEKHDTIYDVSNWMVMRKNFLAGMARSAGAWFFNIIVLLVLVNILIPIFRPFFEKISDMLPENLNGIIVQTEKNNY
ncbi:MAG: hypothetical protein UT13_C0001G0446 [Candidatus Pacebacteria bacterium GW2011_GWF2_38_9]|nr:MAG: hypothetical protein US01_C0001G0458 [candidate division TM6 bacterium GW2011_GWF2_28_16]KKQ10241.1 MAG: hypothetical protein US20_C0002G0042 [Candidatus Pacebacteria bacterium GW2011_GWF1_36_5]KKQ88799.1 MAG: hypothetical protein UT13_C0001G0446 [Candidatus Pacebacteria bacterium GW2011_GWF2_38_9]MBU1033763.1 hypothetical protein [Patescibacteria group bacterium]HAZ73261.1 hypothetical protein [Candidatus Paceibacterota bacterium]